MAVTRKAGGSEIGLPEDGLGRRDRAQHGLDRSGPWPSAPRVRTAATLLAAAAILCSGPTLGAQPVDPSYRLHFAPAIAGGSGSVQTVESLLDIDPSGQPLAAWSSGICHDPTLVQPVGVTPGAILGTLKNGAPVDFLILEFAANLGVVHGVIVCFTSCTSLPPPVDALPLFSVDYLLVGGAGQSGQIAYCDTVAISGNPVSTIVVTTAAGSRVPLQDPATVTIVEAEFRRGDCGNDGSVGIADAIYQLSVLFGPADPLHCADACDANDDGFLNIADPVRSLGHLFGGESPLAPPYPGCGIDPTADALDCAAPTIGC